MPALDDYTCPASSNFFDTVEAKNKRIRQSESCSWYRKELVAQWTAPHNPLDDLTEDVSNIILDDQHTLFQIIPPSDYTTLNADSSVAIGEAGPGPSTQAHRQAQLRTLDDFDDARVIDEYISAGARIRMDHKDHNLWKQRFGRSDSAEPLKDSSAPPSCDPDELYRPFASDLEWRIAHWAVTEGVAQNAINRLLNIPEVMDRLGISFKNYHALNEKLAEIPERAGKWFTRALSLRDQPDEVYILRARDPVEAIRSLWGDPTLAEHLVFRPKKIFADATQRVHRALRWPRVDRRYRRRLLSS